MKILKILKWDKVEYVYLVPNEENYKYARAMIGATLISISKEVNHIILVDAYEESLTFKDLTDIVMGLNPNKNYTDQAVIELIIKFTKQYNEAPANNAVARIDKSARTLHFETLHIGSGQNTISNKLKSIVEYIDVIESVKPKTVAKTMDADKTEMLTEDKPNKSEARQKNTFTPSWYIKPQ